MSGDEQNNQTSAAAASEDITIPAPPKLAPRPTIITVDPGGEQGFASVSSDVSSSPLSQADLDAAVEAVRANTSAPAHAQFDTTAAPSAQPAASTPPAQAAPAEDPPTMGLPIFATAPAHDAPVDGVHTGSISIAEIAAGTQMGTTGTIPMVRGGHAAPGAGDEAQRTAQTLYSVERLREAISAVKLNLDTSDRSSLLRKRRAKLLNQLDDYLIPRLRRMDAPLLAVIGGSTGAGKSTLTNSLVQREVTRAGVLRPTTRSPVLVHHPLDAGAFLSQRILPDLARVTVEGPEPLQPSDPQAPRVTAVRLVPDERMPSSLAIVDAPDIDSLVESNRELAVQLLDAADMWVFVTTANRYSDAAPWEMLRTAAERGVTIAVVLDRVPKEAVQQIRLELADMLRRNGLQHAPVFTIPECDLQRGFLPEPVVEPLRAWLHRIAGDQHARSAISRRTLGGIIGSLKHRIEALAEAADQEVVVEAGLRASLHQAYGAAYQAFETALGNGSLIQGDVEARWRDLIRSKQAFVGYRSESGRLLEAFSRVEPTGRLLIDDVATAVVGALRGATHAHISMALQMTLEDFGSVYGGRAILKDHPELAAHDADVTHAISRALEGWRSRVIDAVHQIQQQRATGEDDAELPFGVEATAVMIMIVALCFGVERSFVPRGAASQPTNTAKGVREDTQRLLRTVLTEAEVRTCVQVVHDDLVHRFGAVLLGTKDRFENLLNEAGVRTGDGDLLRTAATAVREARR